MVDTKIQNRKIIPQLADKCEYIYIEKARIEQDSASICIIQRNEKIPVPICQLSCVLLGPGTTITHRAVSAIADSGCTLVWCGENMRAYYATGYEKDRSSKNLLRQAEYWADAEKHLGVVRKMYRMRFSDIPIGGLDGLSLEQMRGLEGTRMRDIYEHYADMYGVAWNGRIYTPGKAEESDTVNQMLTCGNAWLYHVVRAAVVTLGYSPAIGFIHTGRMDSFVYDIADLYKADIVIPSAFDISANENGSQNGMSKKMRCTCHEKARQKRLLKRIVKDVFCLFDSQDNDKDDTGELWDDKLGAITAGINYGNST